MGVTGLWQVVQPCARPTNIATLNKKRLAVDASIWIYQFLKAVRDKEGNAFRSSHIVGFFRRICKLLWFGILPVFVFDGGVPPLKRQTILNRKQRREGRREDATKTAGRLLTVQMQRYAEMEIEKLHKEKARKKATQAAKKPETETAPREEQEELPDFKDIVYVDELGMPEAERLQKRKKFIKQDPYHLPELTGNIEGQANPDDPRIMSVEQLAQYAEQFGDGGDINLYDFNNIDFEGEFFQNLPPADRYWILNAARLRSRLRMGLSKEQLEAMFPNRMDFSRFQIERARERNHLTQLLMKELGMAGLDLTISGGVGNRIASDQNREYILVKNDGAEGGWALGVVSRDKDLGRRHKPIDIDSMTFEFEGTDNPEEDEDEEFEDVPVEGLNRLPRTEALAAYSRRQAALASQENLEEPDDDDDVMFVGGPSTKEEEELFYNLGDTTPVDEQDDIQKAIELSLKTQHNKAGITTGFSTQDLDDVETPTWEQKAVDTARTLSKTAAKLNLNMLNKRATTEVSSPITKEVTVPEPNPIATDESDSDIDLQTALAMSRKAQKGQATAVSKPTAPKIPTADSTGPLPFPKLDWNFKKPQHTLPKPAEPIYPKIDEDVLEFGGGFEVSEEPTETEKDGPRNDLPPWMVEEEDIAEGLGRQKEAQRRMDAQDREHARLEHKIFQEFRPSLEKDVVEISDNDENIQFVDVPTPEVKREAKKTDADLIDTKSNPISWPVTPERLKDEPPEPEFKDIVPTYTAPQPVTEKQDSPGPEFIDAKLKDTEPVPEQQQVFEIDDDELFGSGASESEKDEDSLLREYEEEQLLAQMAEEADEHARFSNELHNRPKDTAHDSIEAELSQLRNQQRKDRRDADEVTENMILECQALLRLFGIPFITAPMEAEAQCAELVKLGLVDGVITDDSDTFLFGGTRIYKNMFNTSKFVECYIAEDLQQEMSLNRTSLISLAQLLGSDYTEGLPGVGPVTAVEILSEFPGCDGLLEFKKWWEDVQANRRPKEADASSAFRKKFRQSHGIKLFLPSGFPSLAVHEAYTRPDVDSSKENFQWGVPDLDGLRRFLMSTIGWGQERTDEVLVPVIKDMNRREREGTQSNITKYFQGGVGVGASDAFAPRQRIQGSSKRMAQAVNKLRKATLADGPESESIGNKLNNPALLRNTKRKRVTKQKSKKGGDDDTDSLYEGEDKDNEGGAGGQSDNQSQRPRRRRA